MGTTESHLTKPTPVPFPLFPLLPLSPFLLLSPTLSASLSLISSVVPSKALGAWRHSWSAPPQAHGAQGIYPSHRGTSGLSLGCPEKELYPSSHNLPPLWASLPPFNFRQPQHLPCDLVQPTSNSCLSYWDHLREGSTEGLHKATPSCSFHPSPVGCVFPQPVPLPPPSTREGEGEPCRAG